jgi:putative OPT family oligopeptide transporter
MEESSQSKSITLRVILVSLILTSVLAVANTYLALKVGILTSSSIPAAVLAMAALSKSKNVSIYEYNLIQTAASAGEAVAGGIVYVVPALIIINFWNHFDYFTNLMIALIGGSLGVLFSVPLRKILVTNESLPFPEGKAIAEVLKAKEREQHSIKPMVYGFSFAACLEFMQNGFGLFAEHVTKFFKVGQSVFSFGFGFSPALVGAGYLMGTQLSLSLFLGTLLSWCVVLPLMSQMGLMICDNCSVTQVAEYFWNDTIRFLAIGAMLTASLIVLLKLIPLLFSSIIKSMREMSSIEGKRDDIPLPYILLAINVIIIIFFCFITVNLPFQQLSFTRLGEDVLLWGSIALVLILGMIYSTITGYFSGLLGVAATPGSGIFISLILIVAAFVKLCMMHFTDFELTGIEIKAAEGSCLLIASVVAGACAVSIDNIQDLKVGHIIGASPWRQQLMLLFGVVISALIIPFVMQLLLNTYGIGNTSYATGVDIARELPAPPASLLATMARAVFEDTIKFSHFWMGGGIALLLFIFARLAKLAGITISPLGLAVGMYLPFSTTGPILLGGLACHYIHNYYDEKSKENMTMLACGLLAGSAIIELLISTLYIFEVPVELGVISSISIKILFSVITYIGLVIFAKRKLICRSISV